MSVTVSLSTRLPPEVRERLVSAAAARGVAPSTLARDLIVSGLGAGALKRDGAVTNEVECVFYGLGPESGVRREVALALARIVEGGGPGAIAASKELLMQIHTAESLFEPEEDED